MLQVISKPEIEDISPFYRFESIEIKTDADCETAAMGLKEIKNRLNTAEKWRKEVTGPIKQGIKAFEDRVRQITAPLERIEATVKGRLSAYWDSQRLIKEAEERKRIAAGAQAARELSEQNLNIALATGSQTAHEAAQRFERRAEALADKPVEVSQTIRTTGATVAQSTYFLPVVTDANLLPDEYWVIDMERINDIAKSYRKSPVSIPGVEFQERSRAVVR